jgi:pseudouridine-5'-phosphate glycosidase
MNSLKIHFSTAPEVENALSENLPVLALESTIVAHGMPYPENIEFARQAEALVRKYGVVPATIAIIFALTQKLTGATTVSATMRLAHWAGINVFATGGIGGVHRNSEVTFDISQDLIELSRTQIIVVSAGVKAILDIPKTIEYLETFSVPVVGYRTNEFPAFYSRSSGIYLTTRCNTPEEVSRMFIAHHKIGLQSAILVANPVPKSDEIPKIIIDKYIDVALKECSEKNIISKNVTPFLLKRVVELTKGRSLKTNIALALNNVKVGAQIASTLDNI